MNKYKFFYVTAVVDWVVDRWFCNIYTVYKKNKKTGRSSPTGAFISFWGSLGGAFIWRLYKVTAMTFGSKIQYSNLTCYRGYTFIS